MAASLRIAARNNGFSKSDARVATQASVAASREADGHVRRDANAGHLVREPGRRRHVAGDGADPRRGRRPSRPSKKRGEDARKTGARRAPATVCRRCRSSASGRRPVPDRRASRQSWSRSASLLRATVGGEELEGTIHEQFRAYRRRCRTIVDTCWNDSRWSTWHARSWVSAVSGPGRSSCCSRPRPSDPLFLQVKEAKASSSRPTCPRALPPTRRTRGAGPANDAGRQRHLPRLDQRHRGRPRPLLAPTPGHEGLGGRRDDGLRPCSGCTAGSAARRSPGRTPDRGTPSPSPPTSAGRTGSIGRSPTSRNATQTRTNGTTRPSPKRSAPAHSRRLRTCNRSSGPQPWWQCLALRPLPQDTGRCARRRRSRPMTSSAKPPRRSRSAISRMGPSTWVKNAL